MTMTLDELKEAVADICAGCDSERSQFTNADLGDAIDAAIRERDRLRGDVDGLRDCVERAEAELAALKARIDGSHHAFLGQNMDRITFLAEDIGPVGKYALVKVGD